MEFMILFRVVVKKKNPNQTQRTISPTDNLKTIRNFGHRVKKSLNTYHVAVYI